MKDVPTHVRRAPPPPPLPPPSADPIELGAPLGFLASSLHGGAAGAAAAGAAHPSLSLAGGHGGAILGSVLQPAHPAIHPTAAGLATGKGGVGPSSASQGRDAAAAPRRRRPQPASPLRAGGPRASAAAWGRHPTCPPA